MKTCFQIAECSLSSAKIHIFPELFPVPLNFFPISSQKGREKQGKVGTPYSFYYLCKRKATEDAKMSKMTAHRTRYT